MSHQISEFNFSGWEDGPTFTGRVKTNLRLTHFSSKDDVRDLLVEVEGSDVLLSIGDLVGVHVGDRHFRPYYVVDCLQASNGRTLFSLCVRRCDVIDANSGTTQPGLASHFLCNSTVGDTINFSGPYGKPFRSPKDRHANLLMIGVGTGIAPFRAFVKQIYRESGYWRGKVKMFYGARSGLEMLYMNEQRNDFASYESEESFQAFQAVCKHLEEDEVQALSMSLEDRDNRVWQFVKEPATHIYVAGSRRLGPALDQAFRRMTQGHVDWDAYKKTLIAEDRWQSVFY